MTTHPWRGQGLWAPVSDPCWAEVPQKQQQRGCSWAPTPTLPSSPRGPSSGAGAGRRAGRREVEWGTHAFVPVPALALTLRERRTQGKRSFCSNPHCLGGSRFGGPCMQMSRPSGQAPGRRGGPSPQPQQLPVLLALTEKTPAPTASPRKVGGILLFRWRQLPEGPPLPGRTPGWARPLLLGHQALALGASKVCLKALPGDFGAFWAS